MDPGEVVQTPPAGTPFAAVLHAVAVDAFHESTPEVVRAVAREGLRQAAALGARRVALTALATGYGSLNMAQFAEAVAPLVAEAFPPVEEVTVCVRNAHHADELAAALPGAGRT